MKKVLFIHSSSDLYGSDKSLLYLVKNLNKTKYQFYVLLPSDGPLVRELRKVDGVTVVVYNMAVLRRKNLSVKGMLQYTSDFFKSYQFIKKLIKKKKIDIVYTNTSVVFPGAVAARHAGVKSVWHIREIIKNDKERFVVSLIVNHYADVIVANSKATGKSISKNMKKVQVVYNAVEEKSFISDCTSKGDSPEIINIGMAGRINRWKGQKLFVECANIICSKYDNVKFLIAGAAYSGEEYLEDELKAKIKEYNLNDKVTLLGQIDNMDQFYQCLDIFVLPSTQPEPFGLVVIEAMENAIPVVATKHGGPTEIIENGKSGFLVDFESPEEMARICIKLIEDTDLRYTVGLAGQKRKRKMFSLDRMIREIEKVLEI